MANQLNDHQISPTNYMTAFLKQRGWRLPTSTITIPNVIPEVEPKAAAVCGPAVLCYPASLTCALGMRVRRMVWRSTCCCCC